MFFFINSEKLIKEMADHIESDGFKQAGYEYVCIDVSTNYSQEQPEQQQQQQRQPHPHLVSL